jgi:MFS family permease
MTIAPASPPLPPLFRQRAFAALWWGQLASLTGERVAYLALIALLAAHTSAFHDARSSWLLSALANVMLAPVLLFAPFVGAWIDRRPRLRVMIGADVLRAVLVLAMPLAYQFTHSMTPVFALLFLQFTSGVFFLPAKSALTPEIVSGPQRLQANIWLSGAGVLAAALGSLGGGWLVDRLGWAPALVLNSGTYLLSVTAMLVMRGAAAPAPAGPDGPPDGNSSSERPAPGSAGSAMAARRSVSGYLREIRDGLRAVRDDRHIVLALSTLAAVWFAGGFLHVAGNLHVQQANGPASASRLGVLIAVLGAGSAAGTAWLNTTGRNTRRPPLLLASLLLAGVGMLLFAATNRLEWYLAAAFLMGLATIPALMVTETMLQEAAAPALRGRVFGTRDFMMRLVLLASVSLAGGVTRALGAPLALALAGGAVILAGVLAFARFSAAGRTPR